MPRQGQKRVQGRLAQPLQGPKVRLRQWALLEAAQQQSALLASLGLGSLLGRQRQGRSGRGLSLMCTGEFPPRWGPVRATRCSTRVRIVGLARASLDARRGRSRAQWRLAGPRWPRRAVRATGRTGLYRAPAIGGRPLARRLRSELRHFRLLGEGWRLGRSRWAAVMTRSPGRLAPGVFLCFDDGTAPLEFHARSITVLGGNLAGRLAVEVGACRAFGHQGPQVGGPGGVALQEVGQGLLGEDSWRPLMNVGLDAKLGRLDHARTEQSREVLGQQACGVRHAGFGPRCRCTSRGGGSWRRLGRRAQRRIRRRTWSSLGILGVGRHRMEAGRSPQLCSRVTYSPATAPIPARVAEPGCRQQTELRRSRSQIERRVPPRTASRRPRLRATAELTERTVGAAHMAGGRRMTASTQGHSPNPSKRSPCRGTTRNSTPDQPCRRSVLFHARGRTRSNPPATG